MWSRNGSPVATLMRPRPARSTFAVNRDSLLLRATSPFLLLKTNLHCVCVCSQAFHLRQPHACIAEHLEVASVEAQDDRALHKRVDAKGRGEPRGARGGQRV